MRGKCSFGISLVTLDHPLPIAVTERSALTNPVHVLHLLLYETLTLHFSTVALLEFVDHLQPEVARRLPRLRDNKAALTLGSVKNS